MKNRPRVLAPLYSYPVGVATPEKCRFPFLQLDTLHSLRLDFLSPTAAAVTEVLLQLIHDRPRLLGWGGIGKEFLVRHLDPNVLQEGLRDLMDRGFGFEADGAVFISVDLLKQLYRANVVAAVS